MKRILIALCGKTPQIITEALYALHETGRFPSHIIILTTEAGRELCLTHLQHPEHGRLARLLTDLGRPIGCLPLSEADILTPSLRAQRPIADIETEEDSQYFLELCLETVFVLACSPDNELLFSIAGGRKTMSTALALAAQCYARPQDSMFHVLVPPKQEADPQFFYPCVPFHDVHITLIPMPFFRMRNQLPPELLDSPASLETLSHVCRPQAPLHLKLNLYERSLSCEGYTLHLPPALFAVYAFFALKKAPCPKGAEICPTECRACSMRWGTIELKRNDIVHLYQMVEVKALARGQNGILHLSADNFRSSLAKLKKLFVQSFGETTGSRLSIVSTRRSGAAEYCLRIPRTQIATEPQRCEC